MNLLQKIIEKKPISGTNFEVRERLLKIMYAWTFLVAGGIGIAIIFARDFVITFLGISAQDPVTFGILGSFWMAMGLISLIGIFRDPIKYIPVLLVQLTYKVIWYLGVILPVLLTEGLLFHAIVMIIIFATYVIGDLFAIPFPYMFSKPN